MNNHVAIKTSLLQQQQIFSMSFSSRHLIANAAALK